MDLKYYNFDFGTHRDKKVIWIKFEKNNQLMKDLRKAFPSAKWSRSNASWYLPDLKVIRGLLKMEDREWGKDIMLVIHPNNQTAFSHFVEHLKLKAYSKNTIRTYVTEFVHLLRTIKAYPVDDLTPERLKDYFLYCLDKENHLNSRINAVKFYWFQK